MNKNNQHFETIIIGTGFSGLLAATRLKKKHIDNFLMLERSPELGGTWQVNTYPGAEVDIPTSLYSISYIPYPFRKTFAPQSELLDYTNHIIDKFDLRKQAKANQTVTKLTYDESDCVWHVETDSGERYTAQFIVDTSGVLANPKVPDIKGAESFEGSAFHAGHWDHTVDYEGKRVGVIGSGCSAAQIVPAIAGKVSKLSLFMGKAQWILPRADREYSATERFIRTLPGIRHLIRLFVFMFYDIRFVAFRRYPGTAKVSQFMKSNYRKLLKKNLEKHIKDDHLREHMMPDYELGCRRVIPSNTYLPALSRDNVEVDISGIECITPKGIKTKDGKEVALDVIVYATGYSAYSNMKKALTFQVYGLVGRNLNREWEEAAVSYKGITVTAFYRKNMTDEVTSLSPEPVTGFILSRKWFNLSDYRFIK